MATSRHIPIDGQWCLELNNCLLSPFFNKIELLLINYNMGNTPPTNITINHKISFDKCSFNVPGWEIILII